MTAGNSTHISDVLSVGIPVTDQDRALEFYVGKLGFEKRRDFPLDAGGRWIEVAPRGAAATIALVRAHEGLPAGAEIGVRFATADADADHEALCARGVDADQVLHWEGVPPMFAFRDQDGNRLVLIEQR